MESSHPARGCPLGAHRIGVTPGGVGHKSVPSASICGVLVDEGQQGVVGDRLQSHPSLCQLSSSRRSAAARLGSRGPGRSPIRDRASSYVGPPLLKCATMSRVPPSPGGNHRTVAALRPHARIPPARSMLGVCSTSRGGGAPREARTRRPATPFGALGPPAAIFVVFASHWRSGPAP